jgi:hypothetical protein
MLAHFVTRNRGIDEAQNQHSSSLKDQRSPTWCLRGAASVVPPHLVDEQAIAVRRRDHDVPETRRV